MYVCEYGQRGPTSAESQWPMRTGIPQFFTGSFGHSVGVSLCQRERCESSKRHVELSDPRSINKVRCNLSVSVSVSLSHTHTHRHTQTHTHTHEHTTFNMVVCKTEHTKLPTCSQTLQRVSACWRTTFTYSITGSGGMKGVGGFLVNVTNYQFPFSAA